MKKKKEGVAPYNFWTDPEAPDKEFTTAEFKAHLQEEYGIDMGTMKGTRQMLMHMDGDTWFFYQWAWTLAGKKFFQHTRQLRTGMDKEIWSHQD